MKKTIYQNLYRVLLFLSNHLNSKLIIKYKVLLGTSLLVFFNSCDKKDKIEIMCYDPVVVEDTTTVQTVKPDESPKALYDNGTTKSEPKYNN